MKYACYEKFESLKQWFSTWGSRTPGVHGKISRGTWMAVEFSCVAIFNILY